MRHIQQAENLMPDVVFSFEVARVDNCILLDYLTFEAMHEEPENGSTHRNIQIDNNSTEDVQHFPMPGGSGKYKDEGDKIDNRDSIPTTSRRQQAATELVTFNLGSSNVDGYADEDVDDVDGDGEEEASQANDGSTPNMEDWGYSKFDLGTSVLDRWVGRDGDDMDVDEEEEPLQADDRSTLKVEDCVHSTREWDDCTVHFKLVKFDNGWGNATASDVSEVKTVL